MQEIYKSISVHSDLEGVILPKVPSVRFFVSKHVNLFYHTCVLFSEYFPDEYSLGILNNSTYRQQHEHLKTQGIHLKFQNLWKYSFYTWDFVGKSLLESNTAASSSKILKKASQDQMDIWTEILSEALRSYDDIWAHTEVRLTEYQLRFEAEWNLVSESILTKMANMVKLPWKTEFINVHLVDCVYGAQGWTEDVVAPPFPIIDVEKKLVAHELAHILVPDYFLKTKLQTLGLDYTISHTIVDLIAYFGVKEHMTDPDRKGIKPNPDYYVQVPKLYPIFENCDKNPQRYQNFDEILNQIKL